MEIKHATRNRELLTQRKIANGQTISELPRHLLFIVINLMINIPVMNEVWRERRELELMTNDQIKDIGLDPIKVAAECKKSFFDIPTARRKAVYVMSQSDFSRSF